eukprot:TRINITY_DN27131_c0_g3_i1.p1 TRINITY_DN27131_c0_g3~~TRINITY_DN27131_c0_g3_i1.p1  ORF type:complete len:1040 (-),score=174.94 TRINITY_DN27131_c0_g3_i1:184-3303(-)
MSIHAQCTDATLKVAGAWLLQQFTRSRASASQLSGWAETTGTLGKLLDPLMLEALALLMAMILAVACLNLFVSMLMQVFSGGTSSENSLVETKHTQAESQLAASDPAITPDAMHSESTLLDVLAGAAEPLSSQVALTNAVTGASWTYARLRETIASPAWGGFASYRRVAVALPATEELAVALLCLMSRTECAPLDPALAESEITAALTQLGIDAVLLCPLAAPGVASAAAQLGLDVFHLNRLDLQQKQSSPKTSASLQPEATFQAPKDSKMLDVAGVGPWKLSENIVLLLRTSGTTGKSKVVPLCLGQVVQGGRCIAASMGLNGGDVCLNAMPLFHIGGISCNLLGTLLSGGTMVSLGTSFEPRGFTKALCQDGPLKPTWFYCSPSMHLVVADFYHSGAQNAEETSLRLIRSGAAALPGALQERLEGLFRCQVLATYSMSECMPVASPVCSQAFDCLRCQPLGSVGKAIGPTVEICNGEVMLRGSLVMKGYEGAASGWTEEGRFPTGDLGHIDKDGFIWLSGRKKEIINRGGETLAPQVLEDVVKSHVRVKEAAAYAIPHARLGEAVAMAVILKRDDKPQETTDLVNIAQEISKRFSGSSRPEVITMMSDFPRTSTGKVQRLSLHRVLCAGGQPIALSGEERTLTVLDAQGSFSMNDNITCRYLTPEPGTVAAIYEADSSLADTDDVQESIDSLGMATTVSKRQAFEMDVLSYAYAIGAAGITCVHLLWFMPEVFSPSMHTLLGILGGNPAKLMVFFAGAGYSDAFHNPDLNVRDLFMLAMCPLLHPFGIIEAPALWFFLWVLVSRIYVAAGRACKIPIVLQALFLLPYAMIMNDCVMPSLNMKSVSDSDNKHFFGVMIYVGCFIFGPRLVEIAACSGPRTIARQKVAGACCWCMLICLHGVCNVRLRSYELYDAEPLSYSHSGTQQYAKYLLGLMIILADISLLVAACAYLPPSFVPQSVRNSMLGVILSIYFPISSFAFRFLENFKQQPDLIQAFALLCVMVVHMAVLAPLVQGLFNTTLKGFAQTASSAFGDPKAA